MNRFLILLLIGISVFAGIRTMPSFHSSAQVPAEPAIPADSAESAPSTEPEDRVATARALREKNLNELCTRQNLNYPPAHLFLRAIKEEQVLELWAGKNPKVLRLLKTYPLTAFSGTLGPKRREGDLQIPEGVYYIDRFNPKSSFHLSLGLNYPNDSDRHFADPEKPGSDIFIHGRAASVGCLAIGDEAIEELFVIATDVANRSQGRIPVHIFPARMDDPKWNPSEREEAMANPELLALWDDLRRLYIDFEHSRSLQRVTVNDDGRYQFGRRSN